MHSSSQCHKCWYILNKIFRMQLHWIHSWKHAKWLKSFIKVHLCDFSARTSHHLQPLSFISWMCALVPFRSFWGVFIFFEFFSYLKRHLTSCLGLRWGRSNLLRFTPQQELFPWTWKCLLSGHQRQTRMPLCYHHRPCTQKPGERLARNSKISEFTLIPSMKGIYTYSFFVINDDTRWITIQIHQPLVTSSLISF